MAIWQSCHRIVMPLGWDKGSNGLYLPLDLARTDVVCGLFNLGCKRVQPNMEGVTRLRPYPTPLITIDMFAIIKWIYKWLVSVLGTSHGSDPSDPPVDKLFLSSPLPASLPVMPHNRKGAPRDLSPLCLHLNDNQHPGTEGGVTASRDEYMSRPEMVVTQPQTYCTQQGNENPCTYLAASACIEVSLVGKLEIY
ncbi:hypothetical protein AVEN_221121-1 [Araneus ventricosus]|uniref:Uncharacterized protein n=1 Tax=Araneus ventricosus TaxID=182803 RepID=A0A4Y2W990_ARAVE|nr:hypothetical protein AVEN_221121-1 [Araneus ventricosus]